MDILNEHSTCIREIIDGKDYSVDDSERSQWPKATAACSSHLDSFGNQDDRWFAVGDTAMAFDPLSSQGIITALRSGCMLGMSLANETVDLWPLEVVYRDIMDDYATNRKWYYQQVMFNGQEFWGKQKEPLSTQTG